MSPPPADPPDPLEHALAQAVVGEPLSGALLRALRPAGVTGGLLEMPLTEILQNMDFGKRSVRVDVWLDDAEGTVHMHDGQIVYAVATTSAGTTDGESAILEICRRPEGFFRILYVREAVDRNVYRPTTFVLLEALRVIDESTPRHEAAASTRPAAVELGPDPWSDTFGDMFPPDRILAEARDAFDEPSGLLEIDVGPDSPSELDAEHATARSEHPRYRVGAVIHAFIGDAVEFLLLEDIGRGGAFLRFETPPPVGTVVTLRLPTPDVALEVPGRVVHQLTREAASSVGREPGLGLQFDELPGDVAGRLGAFVDGLGKDRVVQKDGAAAGGRDRLLSLVAESEFLVAAGDLESAKRMLSRAQGLAPEDDDVRRKLLNVNESIDAAQANAYLERATRGGPQAVEYARRATQLRPVRDVLLRSLAVFARGGAHDEIADVADQLLELDPDDEGALRTLLDANVAMQRWTLAVRAAESLVRLRPEDEELQQRLQTCLGMARAGGV